MTIKTTVAFFLSEAGDLIQVPDSHIATVIRDPQRFGLSLQEIQDAYSRHGERVGVEGEARKELLLRIIADGWIRIRRYPKKHWSITAPSLSSAVQEHLRDWATRMLSGIGGLKEPDRYMPVRVSTPEGETACTIGDLVERSCPW